MSWSTRAQAVFGSLLLLSASLAAAQAPAPSFDVASVKRSPATAGSWIRFLPGATRPAAPAAAIRRSILRSPRKVSDAPSFFTAIQEQLGLKLESTKGPVDVLVIESVEKPTLD
jgi:hypothetical protein